jgi:adenylylsulfate reductase subunit B
VCAEDVYFASEDGNVPVVSYPEFCFHCNCCVEECPAEAIYLRIPLTEMLLFKKSDEYLIHEESGIPDPAPRKIK